MGEVVCRVTVGFFYHATALSAVIAFRGHVTDISFFLKPAADKKSQQPLSNVKRPRTSPQSTTHQPGTLDNEQ
jgi:hypothetical protein